MLRLVMLDFNIMHTAKVYKALQYWKAYVQGISMYTLLVYKVC